MPNCERRGPTRLCCCNGKPAGRVGWRQAGPLARQRWADRHSTPILIQPRMRIEFVIRAQRANDNQLFCQGLSVASRPAECLQITRPAGVSWQVRLPGRPSPATLVSVTVFSDPSYSRGPTRRRGCSLLKWIGHRGSIGGLTPWSAMGPYNPGCLSSGRQSRLVSQVT